MCVEKEDSFVAVVNRTEEGASNTRRPEREPMGLIEQECRVARHEEACLLVVAAVEIVEEIPMNYTAMVM